MTSLSDPPCMIEHELYVENAVWILYTLSTWECASNERLRPWGRWGGTLIFLYIRRLGPFFGLKLLNFNSLGGFQKNDYYFFLFFFWGGGYEEYFFGVLAIFDIFGG